jgi:cytochrome c2
MFGVISRRAPALLPLLLIASSAVIGFLGCQKTQQSASESQTAAAAPVQDPAARGKYLVTIEVCNDCHTPKKMGPKGPEPDMTRMLSGHPQDEALPKAPVPKDAWIIGTNPGLTAWYGPWGVSFSANLTPDTTTGIGAWTEDMFVQSLRNGKHMGTGRDLLPPMPWQFIGQMTDEDLKAVFAYLKTLPPIKNQVPQPIPPKS